MFLKPMEMGLLFFLFEQEDMISPFYMMNVVLTPRSSDTALLNYN